MVLTYCYLGLTMSKSGSFATSIKYLTIVAYRALYNISNKAIRDGKYLALPHSSAWQRFPHFFRDVISLLARVFIFLIDRATQEVPIKNI